MNTETQNTLNGNEVAMAKRLRLKSAEPKTTAKGKRTSDMVYDARADIRTIKKYEDDPGAVDMLDLRTWTRYMLLALEWDEDEFLDTSLRELFDLVDD